MREATELEQAYMAGFMDGEGSFFIERIHKNRDSRPGHRPRASAASTVLLSLSLFIEVYGGTLIKTDRSDKNHKDSYMWHCPASELERMARDLEPSLRTKASQVRLILDYIGLLHERENKINDDVWQKRESIRLTLKELNHRGR